MKSEYRKFLMGLMMLLLLAGAMPAMAASAKIAVYSDHMSISDTSSSGLSAYANALRAQGYTVEQIYDPITSSKLDGCEALLMIGLGRYLSSTEKSAIEDFVENQDKGLLLSGGSSGAVNDLSQNFTGGSEWFGSNIVCDPTDYEVYPKWVKIQTFYDHPITENLDRIVMYKGTNIPAAWFYGGIIGCAYSDEDSWLDEDGDYVYDTGESRGTQPVLAYSSWDKIVIVPDANVFDNSDADGDGVVAFYEYDNDVLGLNVARWLAGAEEGDVKIKGEVTNIWYPISFPPIYTIDIDEVIEDPLNKFHGVAEILVSYDWGTPAEIDSGIEIGDNVDVYGAYCEGGYDIILTESEHYLKRIEGTVHNIDTGESFTKIQEAINDYNTLNGHTIKVNPGTYTENIDVTKSLTIKSTSGNPEDTIVQAVVSDQNVFTVTADNVNIDGFTIRGASSYWCSGIWINSDNCIISNNTFEDNAIGIWTHPPSGNDNTIRNNNFASSSGYSPSTALYIESSDNVVYLNNFFIGAMGGGSYFSTLWHSPAQITYEYEGGTFTSYLGNYWAGHTDVDAGNDGIWDHAYSINDDDTDYYPLVKGFENYIPTIIETGTLVVNVYNVNGNPAAEVGGTTTVKLIRSGEVLPIAEQTIDGESKAAFTVPTGEYYINVWHNPQVERGAGEFWGQQKDISIASGITTTIDFYRYNPYVEGFYAEESSVAVNTPVNIDVVIKAPSNFPNADVDVKASIIVKDENGDVVRYDGSSSRSVQKGESTTFSFSYAPTEAGTYYGLAKAYVVGGGELCTDNCGWVELFEACEEKPDLIVEDILWWPPSPNKGDVIDFSIKVKNKGSGSAEASSVNFYIDNILKSDPIIIPPLSPDESCERSERWHWTADKCGDVQVKFIVDPNNRVDESDEKNNESAKVMPISCEYFDPLVDGYCFNNDDELKGKISSYLYEEMVEEIPKKIVLPYPFNSLIGDYMVWKFMEFHYSSMGLCAGMSTSSALYYIKSSLKPLPIDTYKMNSTSKEVLGKIAYYQARQVFYGGGSISNYNIRDEYEKIKKAADEDKPKFIALGKTNETTGEVEWPHAVVGIRPVDEKNDYANISIYDPNFHGKTSYFGLDFKQNRITTGSYEYLKVFDPIEVLDISTVIEAILNWLSDITSKNLQLLSFGCPVNVTITDQHGRVISDYVNQIPSAEVIKVADKKVFIIPVDLAYSVDIGAYDSGTFNFTRVSPVGNDISITKFENIPITASTKAFVEIVPDVTNYTMSIDYDGDGGIDYTKYPDVNETIEMEQNSYTIQLHTGWNLISTPLVPEDTGAASVLSPISGNYSIIWEYNASDATDHWKKYDPSAPFGNDLTDMEPGKGYWILMTSDDTLPITGTVPESTDISLTTGWNLIGYDSLDSQPIADALASISDNYDIVWGYDASDTADHWKKYDPSAPFGNDLTDMEPGKGYWILIPPMAY